MDLRFDNKIAVITGAAGGLGYKMAESFAESGAVVVICDIKSAAQAAQNLKDKGFQAAGYALDVTNRENVKEVFAHIHAEFGGIDILVNNAGINVGPDKRAKFFDFDDAWWDAIINVDLGGVYNCSKAAYPYMKDREGANIVNISSITGIVPLRNQCAFTAAKAGVVHLTKAMAIELGDQGIRVNCVAPGTIGLAVTNRLWQNDSAMEGLLSHIPMHRQGTPDDIAAAVLFTASEEAAYMTGNIMTVDGGWICGFSRDF